MAIEFKGLRIRRNYKGVLKGELELKGTYGTTELNIDEETCKTILGLCAEGIVSAASEIAEHMKSEAARIDVIPGRAIEREENST